MGGAKCRTSGSIEGGGKGKGKGKVMNMGRGRNTVRATARGRAGCAGALVGIPRVGDSGVFLPIKQG